MDAIVAYGDTDAAVRRVRQRLDAGADHVCLQVLTADPTALPEREWREPASAPVPGSGPDPTATAGRAGVRPPGPGRVPPAGYARSDDMVNSGSAHGGDPRHLRTEGAPFSPFRVISSRPSPR